MEYKELTEEQKKKLKKLVLSHIRKSALSGIKVGALLAAANILVCVVAFEFLDKNNTFVFVGAILNAIFILPILSRDARKEHDRMKEEAKKILEN